jgi:hypothetical protein
MSSIKNVLKASRSAQALPNNRLPPDTAPQPYRSSLAAPSAADLPSQVVHINREYFGREEPRLEELCTAVTDRATGRSFNLANHISASWKVIGLTLGMEPNRLTSIERKGYDDSERLMTVFSRWLENAAGLPHHADYPLSWQGLNTLLQNTERREVAKQYFEFLNTISS